MPKPTPGKTGAARGAWRLRWQGFWSRRAGLRLNGALLFTLLALLAALYLALPSAQQQTLQQAALSAASALGATGLTVAIEVVLAGSIVCALSLLFAPGYRYGRYLTLHSAQPAPVAVYMDGENVTEDRHIQAIVSRLRREYAHRRLDMLFFAQVAGSEHSKLHRTLYLYGFRPIQVPHDPTGTNRISEAADKELAMHALQRALVGPAKQEFILIARDGGYVPLVYRLAALGHSVQVWSPDPIQAYHIVRDYLKIEVVNLSKEAANMAASPHRAASATVVGADAPSSAPTRAAAAPAPTRYTVVAPPPVEFNQPNQATRAGMNALYHAIYNTVELSRFIRSQKGAPEARHGRWFTALGNDVRDALAAVGYSGSGYGSRWQRLLISVGALKGAGKDCPEPGDVSPSEAAAQVYALALATAQAACQALPNRPEDAITMQTVSSNIQRAGAAGAPAQALVALADPRNRDRSLAVWFLLSCARALGLVEFDVEADSRDLIKAPRLTPLAESLVAKTQAPEA